MSTIKVAVFGAGKNCGVSFVSLLCSKALLQKGSVSLVEVSSPYFYSALAFDRRFVSREFSAAMDKIRLNESIVSPVNLEENIEWWLRMPKDSESLQAMHLFRLLYAPKTDFAVFDCSGTANADAAGFAAEADKVIFVIDPLPTKLMANSPFLSRLISCCKNVSIVVNKDNKGVNQKELSEFLGGRPTINIPYLEPENFYKAEFIGKDITEIAGEKYMSKFKQQLLKALV